MKKLLTVLTALTLLISLAACATTANPASSPSDTPAPTASPALTPTPTPTPSPTLDPTDTPIVNITPTPPPANIPDGTEVTVVIPFTLDGRSDQIYVEYTQNGDRREIAYDDSTINIHVRPIGDSNRYVLAWQNSLYTLDLDKFEISKLLNNESGNYRWDKIQDLGCIWGEIPTVNKAGTKMVFQTTRDGKYDVPGEKRWVDSTYPLWEKDLVTGEEKMIYPTRTTGAWWIGDTLYVTEGDYEGTYNHLINLETKQTLVDNVLIRAFDTPYIYFLTLGEYGTLKVYNEQTGKIIRSVTIEDSVCVWVVRPDKEWATIFYSPLGEWEPQPYLKAKLNILTGELVMGLKLEEGDPGRVGC
ncbi:hypothetical protein FACS1894217_01330 [Clostridia bacterium]|nr:hypothetical protein FACS1894217_01330 [Clostridia bacterium]